MPTLEEKIKQDIEDSKKEEYQKSASIKLDSKGTYMGCFNDWSDPNEYVSYDMPFKSMAEFSKYADAFLQLGN